eukprot:CAMPEP_0177436290 /NCGR_PEP_ID=MMETSP0369-20130122/1564_1 /TAXON_ID=447022 ORGANISM="Scrippsiella hangoei-like, Strain SHHI-4" /NCGR_SAMPLE_ID=MMETSP0369 /ASSEMBLY_ACC=CAM_ASM_000364 /LENGTH=141 /DNA_ID=CAMNT_0018907623 /DNA_START=489 /DNA_END=914 /DNA_ORIENTATION=-
MLGERIVMLYVQPRAAKAPEFEIPDQQSDTDKNFAHVEALGCTEEAPADIECLGATILARIVIVQLAIETLATTVPLCKGVHHVLARAVTKRHPRGAMAGAAVNKSAITRFTENCGVDPKCDVLPVIQEALPIVPALVLLV